MRRELKAYGGELDKKKEIVALSKCDALTPDVIAEKAAALKKAARKTPMIISAVSGQGMKEALYALTREMTRATHKDAADSEGPDEKWQP